MRSLPSYFDDFRKLKAQRDDDKQFPFGSPYPCFEDKFSESGSAEGHYFHQDLLVARRIYLNDPETHVDIGSRIDGFVAHVAVFRPIEVIDIRPQKSEIPNIKFIEGDLTKGIGDELKDYCDSLSCLHALEHFGLGRYGDAINYKGHLAGLTNISKILRQGGKFYLSVPIGRQRIEFNAHRVFSMSYLLELLEGKYRIDRFSFVDDKGDLHENACMKTDKIKTNFDCRYGCGIFETTKL